MWAATVSGFTLPIASTKCLPSAHHVAQSLSCNSTAKRVLSRCLSSSTFNFLVKSRSAANGSGFRPSLGKMNVAWIVGANSLEPLRSSNNFIISKPEGRRISRPATIPESKSKPGTLNVALRSSLIFCSSSGSEPSSKGWPMRPVQSRFGAVHQTVKGLADVSREHLPAADLR